MATVDRIRVQWGSGQPREFVDLDDADAALLERRLPAIVTIYGVQLHVTSVDLINPEFSLLDVPFFREGSP